MLTTLTAAQKDAILDAAELPEESATATYSGRCMYGEQCVGFDVDDAVEMMRLSAAIGMVLGQDAPDMLGRTRTDSMGLGVIVYFPGVTAEGWTDYEDEEEE